MSKVIDFKSAVEANKRIRKQFGQDELYFNVIALCLVCTGKWIGTVKATASLFQLECPHCKEFDSFASFIPDEYLEQFGEGK